MVYTQSEPTNQKTDQYSSRHTKIVAKKNPKWKGFVLLPIDPQWFPWRNLCFWTFARCSHYTWRLCCRPLTYEKDENPPGARSTIHLWLQTILAASSDKKLWPVFTISWMIYETETTPQQPINQPQNNDGHSGPKPYWLMTDAVWSGRGSREHNNHLIVAVFLRSGAHKPRVSDVDKWTRGGGDECSREGGSV